jgi:hypothetical protein
VPVIHTKRTCSRSALTALPRGLYHYACDAHYLRVVKPGASRRDVRRYIPQQWWYENAAVIIFMTAVFPRVQWRYDTPRAYRSVLVEAGHFCQTFLPWSRRGFSWHRFVRS